MQNSTETPVVSNPLERRIELTIARGDVDQDVEQRLKRLARTVKMAGFRPGKVPFKVVAQQYEPQVRHEAIGEALERVFGEAIVAQQLRVAGAPRIEVQPGENQDVLQFSATFEVYPEIALGDLSGQTIERPVLEVGDAELEQTLTVLRKQRTTFKSVERAAASGDKVVIDFTGRLDGEVFQGGEAKDFSVVLGEGRMLPDFEAGVVGMTIGETRSFDVAFPADYHAANLAGKTAQFEATLKSVDEAVLPELDDEFARSMGVLEGGADKLRTEVRTSMEREVKKRIQSRTKEQAMLALLDANPIDVPKALVDEEAMAMAQSARQDMVNRGIDAKNVPVEPSWFAEQASRRVKLGLLVGEVVKAQNITANDEQVRSFLEEMAQSYEEPKELIDWYYSRPENLREVRMLVVENNVVNWVLANAQVTDKAVAFNELMGTQA